jgi:hypothetical protein
LHEDRRRLDNAFDRMLLIGVRTGHNFPCYVNVFNCKVTPRLVVFVADSAGQFASSSVLPFSAFTATPSSDYTGCPKSIDPEECHSLFTLYALYVYPDTLRISSAALPCLFVRIVDSNTTVCNSLPKVKMF